MYLMNLTIINHYFKIVGFQLLFVTMNVYILYMYY